jgi:hypothetical protein
MKRIGVVAILGIVALLAGCNTGAKTEVKPGTSTASGKSVETMPTTTQKTRTVLRVRPVPSAPIKESTK